MLALVLFARDRAALKQGFQTRPIGLGVLQRRRVAGEDRLRLLQRRLEGARIEAEQGGRPCRTSSPSAKWMALSWPVACARMSTLEMASAVPTAGIVRGTALRSARAVETGTVAPAESLVPSLRADDGRVAGAAA